MLINIVAVPLDCKTNTNRIFEYKVKIWEDNKPKASQINKASQAIKVEQRCDFHIGRKLNPVAGIHQLDDILFILLQVAPHVSQYRYPQEFFPQHNQQ